MFRSIQKYLPGGGGRNQQLPGSYNAPPSSPWKDPSNWFKLNNNGNNNQRSFSSRDGSAASIHTAPTIKEAWKRASVATKATWIAFIISIIMIWFGWRWIKYATAGININCNSFTCEVSIQPIGWGKKITIKDVARQQLLSATAIKTYYDGTFVTDENIQLHDNYSTANKGGKKGKKSTSSYKGPDENGHYLTYAIYLTDRADTQLPDYGAEAAATVEQQQPSLPVDLYPLKEYLEELYIDNKRQYRIIPRKFGVKQSKRRVRTMFNKVDSYIRRRRQKLTLKENSPPSVIGVLLMVFGFIIFIVTSCLGQFTDPVIHSGPGVRRQNSSNRPHSTIKDTLQTTTPARYEVSTTPKVVSASGYKRNTTTARKRGT